MDKAALERKLREIYKATCGRIEERHFTPLLHDAEDWEAWGKLHAWAMASDVDEDYVMLIEQCTRAAAKKFLGDKC